MTTYTNAQLATRVLKDLGLVGAEETPSAVDQSWAEETCSSEIMLLQKKEIVLWNTGDDSISQEYLTALSRRIGLALGPSFGLFSTAQAEQMMPLAEANLRILGEVKATGATQEAEYF